MWRVNPQIVSSGTDAPFNFLTEEQEEKMYDYPSKDC
jgi:hypothetical protein